MQSIPSSIESNPSGVKEWSKHGYTIDSTCASSAVSFETASMILLIELNDATAAKIDSPSSSSLSWPISLMYCYVRC
jgi:hypothetical protein